MLRIEFEKTMEDLTAELKKQSEEAMKVIQNGGITLVPVPSGPDLKAFFAIHDRVARDLSGKIYPKDLLIRVYSILKRPIHW